MCPSRAGHDGTEEAWMYGLSVFWLYSLVSGDTKDEGGGGGGEECEHKETLEG